MMRRRWIGRACAAALAVAAIAAVAPARAETGPSGATLVPLTTGTAYDRNPAVVQDGETTWMFFARTENPNCDRIAGCNADNTTYDLYYQQSSDGGDTWGAPVLFADNGSVPLPQGVPVFYGRTTSATRDADGTLTVLWTSGGNSSTLAWFQKAPNTTTWTSGYLTDDHYFNADAVSVDGTVFVYAQLCCEVGRPNGTYVKTFDGATFSEPELVLENGFIPKVIVDQGGTFRLVATDDTAWPDVDVLATSSSDGTNFTAPFKAVDGDGTLTNWDPTIAQAPDGTYHLLHAPDDAGRQYIEQRTSETFEGLGSADPVAITSATDGTTAWWDYWPEAAIAGGELRLYYTSEAPTSEGGDPGTGHIWEAELPGPPPVTDLPASIRGNRWLLRNSLTTGEADSSFRYGHPDYQKFFGDWDGDGTDTPGVFNSETGWWHLSNSMGPPSDMSFKFGDAGDLGIVGDWDGDGVDTIGVRKAGAKRFLLRNSLSNGTPDLEYRYAVAGATIIVGDWNGDEVDTLAARNPGGNTFHMNDGHDSTADFHVAFGASTDLAVAGDWDGDGIDTVGIRKADHNLWQYLNSHDEGPADGSFRFGRPEDTPLLRSVPDEPPLA